MKTLAPALTEPANGAKADRTRCSIVWLTSHAPFPHHLLGLAVALWIRHVSANATE